MFVILKNPLFHYPSKARSINACEKMPIISVQISLLCYSPKKIQPIILEQKVSLFVTIILLNSTNLNTTMTFLQQVNRTHLRTAL